jgi:pimeloyl-CoA synthetase
MKYTIEIETDTLDAIFRQIIVEDYRSLCRDIKALKKERKTNGLMEYQIEDLSDNIRYRDALKIAITYYFAHDEAREILGKKHDKV